MNKPDEFKDRLQEVMSALFRLMDTAKEREAGLEQKTVFEASGQFERPHEFLQSLLDMAGAFLIHLKKEAQHHLCL